MTHMYGSGVFHWKTKNGSNVQYWKRLIEDIQGGEQWDFLKTIETKY